MPTTSQQRDGDDGRSGRRDDRVVDQLCRLEKAITSNGYCLDDVYQVFRELDAKNRGYLSSSIKLSTLFRAFLPSRDRKAIQFEVISAHFARSRSRFDYEAFFRVMTTLDDYRDNTIRRSSPTRSPTRRQTRSSRSPTKRDHRSASFQVSVPAPTDDSESDMPSVGQISRVDRLLEIQQRLQTSIRKKLLQGMVCGRREGYLGVEDALFQLDSAGDGYLPEQLFVDKFLAGLKRPLSEPEMDFLLAQLKSRGRLSENQGIDYEQLGVVFGLDGDDSASEWEVDSVTTSSGVDGVPSPTRRSQLGSEFLAAEKRLTAFLHAPWQPSSNAQADPSETPRSVFTGAERFLELAEEVDRAKTGLMHEKCFGQLLSQCGVDIPDHIMQSILSRFPRVEGHSVSYSAFLHRYGQNPEQSRERRELKQLVGKLVEQIKMPISDWVSQLRQCFDKYDKSLAPSIRGALVQPEFLRLLTRHCEATNVPVSHIAPISRTLARLSDDKMIRHHEFFGLINEWAGVFSTKSSIQSGDRNTAAINDGTTVGDYLMFHATSQERRHFEQLMDLLHEFQQTVVLPTGEAATAPAPNGVVLTLGEKLKVQIQFRF